MQYLEGLNDAQKEAVFHTDGPLMIIAGAGAGKTKTITHRIAHLIASGVPSDSILAVTFTNKAAGEMRERVSKLLATIPHANAPLSMHVDRRMPFVSTFHSLGVRLLREHAAAVGLPRSFVIWDRADSAKAVKKALEDIGYDKRYEPRTVLSKISRIKGDGVTLAEFGSHAKNPWEQTVATVWRQYEEALKHDHALDFDDLLLTTLELLSKNEGVLERCRARWSHITIDEYQDTNRVQFELAHLLTGDKKNICVVGDIDQNIYSWRGADIEHLLSFEKIFPGTKVVLLEQNYRSTQTILAVAQDIISKNKHRFDKKLTTANDAGEPVSVYYAMTEQDEAYFVAGTCAELIAAGTPAKEIAVLYRANFQSRVLEEAFLQIGVPYRVLGTKFFDRKEIKDVLSYLRAAFNQKSAVDIARIVCVPPRGIGKATLAKILTDERDTLTGATKKKVDDFFALLDELRAYAEKHAVSETLKFALKKTGIEADLRKGGEEGMERLENLRELVTLSLKYDDLLVASYMKPSPTDNSVHRDVEKAVPGIEKLLEDAALLGEQDSLDDPGEKNTVSLMTVHASKGLEFDVVFVVGLEEGLFPHERNEEGADTEEERRLFYVALTRARKKVFLSHAATRMLYGTRTIGVASQFLTDISPEYTEQQRPGLLGGGPIERVIR
ncbi:UvrD-helicase domain-containing protein [Candidatus Kaiserbacteria bacterium]|nr:UvrD-helicase domain-containing protein [Candidatus Kaiserbacteria bacterium]